MDGGNDERAVFREAMLGVTPLKRQNRVPPSRPRPAARARFSREAHLTVLEESLCGELVEQAGGEIEFRRDGVGAEILRALCNGRFAVADELDLHRMPRVEAENARNDIVAT